MGLLSLVVVVEHGVGFFSTTIGSVMIGEREYSYPTAVLYRAEGSAGGVL